MTFSIVIESANLNVANRDRLKLCIDSIFSQSIIQNVDVVYLVNNGVVSNPEISEFLSSYPRLEVLAAPNLGYEELKIFGAQKVFSDIVVFADSDCIYQVGWLENLVFSFRDSNVDLVGGVTFNVIHSSFDLACALTNGLMMKHEVPSQSIYVSDHYHQNSFACRLAIWNQTPVPTNGPLYRMCSLHAVALSENKIEIRRQPQAIAIHPAPDGWIAFIWLYLAMGHDTFALSQIRLGLDRPKQYRSFIRNLYSRSILKTWSRFFYCLKYKTDFRKAWLWACLPYVFFAILFEWIGGFAYIVLGSKKFYSLMPKNILNSTSNCFR